MAMPWRWFIVTVCVAAARSQAVAQGAPAVSIRAGVAISNRYGNTAREAGPDLGVAVVFGAGHRVALEASGSASIFGSSVAIPVCLPGLPDPGGCSTHVSAPGAVLGAGLGAIVRMGDALGVFGGVGFSASGSFPDEPTVEHRSAWSVLGGLRLHPFQGTIRGLGLELRATRFTRAIGEVRTVIAPSLTWTF